MDGPVRPRGERTGVIVLRAWLDRDRPDSLRIRITRVIGSGEPQVTAAATVDGGCAAVRAWLEELIRPDDPPGPSPR